MSSLSSLSSLLAEVNDESNRQRKHASLCTDSVVEYIHKTMLHDLDVSVREYGIYPEIEFRVGNLESTVDNRRLTLPILSSSVYSSSKASRFASSTQQHVFENIRQYLNALAEPKSRGQPWLKYEKTECRDYKIDGHRVTTDASGSHVISCMMKDRISSIDIYRGLNSKYDVRIGAAIERELPRKDVSAQLSRAPSYRHKLRRSYSSGFFRFDLTEVREVVLPIGESKRFYEVEMELVEVQWFLSLSFSEQESCIHDLYTLFISVIEKGYRSANSVSSLGGPLCSSSSSYLPPQLLARTPSSLPLSSAPSLPFPNEFDSSASVHPPSMSSSGYGYSSYLSSSVEESIDGEPQLKRQHHK